MPDSDLRYQIERVREKYKKELFEYKDMNDDFQLKRFIEAKQFNSDKIDANLNSYFQYWAQFDFVEIEKKNIYKDHKDIIDKLGMVFYHHDKEYRPIILITPNDENVKVILEKLSIQ